MTSQPKLIQATTTEQIGNNVDRDAYRARLQKKLKDSEFRATEGFPVGSDEAILAMSDPPYHTACPNPFLGEFVEQYGHAYDPEDSYHREPFAVDVSVGKTNALYRAHSYHTKVPHLAIVPSILHYTEPGDIVLDGFCGSGMTGVAAQFCGSAPEVYRAEIAQRFREEGRPAPAWGTRHAILNDLSPAATFIAANYTIPVEVNTFGTAASTILEELQEERGWMYETRHTDGTTGRIEYTVWSEVFLCATCSTEIVFYSAGFNEETRSVGSRLRCQSCGSEAPKERLELVFESVPDRTSGRLEQRPKRIPVKIIYKVGSAKFEKRPDESDIQLLERLSSMPLPAALPSVRLPDCQMTRVGRMRTTNTVSVESMFLPRQAQTLGWLWSRVASETDLRLRHMLLFWIEQAIWGMSTLNRYTPTHFSHVNQYMTGVFYVASHLAEVSPWYNLQGKLERLVAAFATPHSVPGTCILTTGTCSDLAIATHSIDYIFTDPPFGENIYYADLNFLVESWHGVTTRAEPEAIVDRAKGKRLLDYQHLMHACFAEYHRVLKPGRWMTVVFHNSSNGVWNAIQEAILGAGFVIADVRSLDKQQGSFRQLTSTAVKQDLVISAYKPTEGMERAFELKAGTPEGVWNFVHEHLANLPVTVEKDGVLERVAERQRFRLYDRMVAFHVQRGVSIPLSAADFFTGLGQRFIERDGMIFLSEQAAKYDAARLRADRLGQLSYYVDDEKSSIAWLRQQFDPALGGKPQTYQEIQPKFLRELNQARHEALPELRDILDQNFLEDPQGRWYPPDPAHAGDLEKLRLKSLLREFEAYLGGQGKLRQFRTEAVRAGFAAAYGRNDFQTIVDLAERLPETVLQEDPDLWMYYDAARLRV